MSFLCWRGFICSYNQLTSLEFCPSIVERGYDCAYNKLTNLIGSPDKVNWKFYCYNNKLTTLEGVPSQLGNYLDCSDNELTSLDHCPTNVTKLYCNGNPISKWWNQVSSISDDNSLLELFIDMGINSNDPDEYNESRIKEILEY